ncbi:MAG: hypothetical protein K0S61_1441 [Anaerocolumna sp.]|jgi:hypothetical protein|nr:hypothetical protein [Anaerocolumna sp.]
MNGTIITLMDKLLDFHIYFEGFYESLLKNKLIIDDYALKNTAAILKSLESKHCKLYRETIESYPKYKTPVSSNIISEVDFSLITLKQSLNSYGIMNPKQMLANAIDYENKQIFLLSKIIDMLKVEIQENDPIDIMEMLKREEENNLELINPFM